MILLVYEALNYCPYAIIPCWSSLFEDWAYGPVTHYGYLGSWVMKIVPHWINQKMMMDFNGKLAFYLLI